MPLPAPSSAAAAGGEEGEGEGGEDAGGGDGGDDEAHRVAVEDGGEVEVLGVDEEVEAVQDVLGASTVLCGFYSNGEICPGYQLEACSLHNQTMTITYLAEAV